MYKVILNHKLNHNCGFHISCESGKMQTCTNTWNTSIPAGVLSFQVVFVHKFNLMEDISLLSCWP